MNPGEKLSKKHESTMGTIYKFRRLEIIILLAALLASCMTYDADQDVSIQQIEFSTEDDIRLSGTLYIPENGEIAVVLAHQGTIGTNQQSWQSFAETIAENGFVALTFDFRGAVNLKVSCL